MKSKNENSIAGGALGGGGPQTGMGIVKRRDEDEDYSFVKKLDLPDFVKGSKDTFDKVLSKHSDLSHGDILSFAVTIKPDDEEAKKLLNDADVDAIADKVREAIARSIVKNKMSEVVRKRGDSWVLYSPNKGKKHRPKPVGEFPTRVQAKRAELSRFPPDDPKQLQRLRKQLQRMEKNPAKAEKKKVKTPFKESQLRNIISSMLNEASLWDSVKNSLGSDVLARDKAIVNKTRAISRAKEEMLDDAVSSFLSSIDKKLVKVTNRDDGNDYIALTVKVAGQSLGTVKFKLADDGSTPRVVIETSDGFEAAMTKLDPKAAKEFKSELALVQSGKVDGTTLKRAEEARDKQLQKSQDELDRFVSSLTQVEVVLLKNLLSTKYRNKK